MDDDKNAMRAYLQRVEVRLSTMHRIASAFLGGAGLLILFPIFFSNAIANQIKILLIEMSSGIQIWISICLLIPLATTIGVPIYALGLLLKDLVHFYFVGHSPGSRSKVFSPRFVLSGMELSSDEAKGAKRDVMIYQYSTDLLNFIIPFGEPHATYYDEVIASHKSTILPSGRTVEKLISKGVLRESDDQNEVIVESLPNCVVQKQDIDRFAAAYGLTGTIERTLTAEVAKAEVSLVRHGQGLRRLLFRYVKALLLFIQTALISFMLIAVIDANKIDTQGVLSVGYLIWAGATMVVVRLPIKWVNETANLNSESVVNRDEHLVKFQRKVDVLAIVASIFALVALILVLVKINK